MTKAKPFMFFLLICSTLLIMFISSLSTSYGRNLFLTYKNNFKKCEGSYHVKPKTIYFTCYSYSRTI